MTSIGWATTVHATEPSAAIDDLLDRSADAYGTVGHSVAVLRRGRLVYSRHAGLSDRETGAPITDASVYPLFSISKLFVIVELLKARQAGLINLDASLATIRAGLPSAWAGITLLQALAHVSGLPDYIPDHVEPTDEQAFASIATLPPVSHRARVTSIIRQTSCSPKSARTGDANAADELDGASVRSRRNDADQLPCGGATPVAGHGVELPPGSQARSTAAALCLSLVAGLYLRLAGRLHDAARSGPMVTGAALWCARAARGASGIMVALCHAVPECGVAHPWVGILSARRRDDRRPWRRSAARLAAFLPSGRPGRQRDGDLSRQWRPYDVRPPSACHAGRRSRHAGVARKDEEQEEALYRGMASGRWEQASATVAAAISTDRLEAIVNRVGYDAMNILDAEAALPVFRWNAERFPRSANAHDSLGEAYRAAGQCDRAKESYARALALDPANDRLKATIDELNRAACCR